MKGRIGTAALAGLLLAWSPAGAGIPPPGFIEETIISTVPQITGFDWSPSGDLYILSKLGSIARLRAGETTPVTLATLPVNTTDDGGVLGLALDPAFAVNGWLYIYYTVPSTPAHNRLSRFTVSGDTLVGELILLEFPDLTHVFHYAGHLRFDPTGRLLVSVGDNGQPAMSQDKGSLLGKLLRINPDGSIPPDNPFFTDPLARPEVWAYGLRNPWRFSQEPSTGTLFIGDVGDGTWEELDLGIPGANYGYPLVEGPAPPGVVGTTYPIYSYPHNGQSAAITGGEHMTAGNFPAQYVGSYFFGDSSRGIIWQMVLDGTNTPISVTEFLTAGDRPVHIRTGPDGALWYATIFPSAIRRVSYVGGTNSQPIPVAFAVPAAGLAPLPVTFDGSGSSDPDGNPLTYTWTFGDGGFLSGVTAQHIYPNPGVFFSRLIVSDGLAQRDTLLRIVSGNRIPTATILSPSDNASFVAGSTINFSGQGIDPEDGTLLPSGLSWTVLFHHNTHTHPYIGPQEGIAAGSFQIVNTGEPAPDIWYEIILTATDSGAPVGANATTANTTSIRLNPVPASLQITTTPATGLALTLDAHPIVSPVDVDGVAGFLRDVSAVSPQTPGDGHTYTFASWSDLGSQSHTITMPTGAGTLTAQYVCDVITEVEDLRASLDPSGDVVLTWAPAADPCLAVGARYRVWSAATAFPAAPSGVFPLDPAFSIAAVTYDTTVSLDTKPGNLFFVVEAIGSDGASGPIGSYGR